MTLGCQQLPTNLALNNWKVDFKPWRERRVAYWHVLNFTEDMPQWEQVSVFYKVFNEINYHLAKYNCHLQSTSNPENALKGGILIRFSKNDDPELPVKFEEGVLAYAIRGLIYVNEELFWQARDSKTAYDLVYALTHESLHSLGLDHTTAPGDIQQAIYAPGNYITQDSATALGMKYGAGVSKLKASTKKYPTIYIALIVILLTLFYLLKM